MSTLAQLAEHARGNLEEQARCHRHLLDLARAQQDALLAQDSRRVHEVLQELEVAMVDRARSDVRRYATLQAIATALGITRDDVTADVLCAAIGDPAVAAAIAAAGDELRAVVGELDGIVARNRALLQHELGVIDSLVQGMTVDRTATPMYGKTGAQYEHARIRILDAQV